MIAKRLPAFWDRLDALRGADLVPEWLDDKQARSRATRDKVLRAAESMLRNESFADISMEDLAGKAGISIGALYARFPSKDSVLGVLALVVFDGVAERFQRALADLPESRGLRDVVQTYVSTLVGEFVSNRRLVMEVRRNAGASADLRHLMRRTNAAIHTAFLERAGGYVKEIDHPRPEVALRYGLFMVNAAAREAILSGVPETYGLPDDAGDLGVELVWSFCAYLGIDPPKRTGRRPRRRGTRRRR